jgi:L-asparaginase
LAVPTGAPLAQVALLTASLGDDGRLVDLVCGAGFDGLVVEAFGGGHVSDAVAPALARAAAIMPVVIASRTGAGETLQMSYAFAGSETDLTAAGMLFAGGLDAPKARLLLTFLLSTGVRDRAALADAFARASFGA